MAGGPPAAKLQFSLAVTNGTILAAPLSVNALLLVMLIGELLDQNATEFSHALYCLVLRLVRHALVHHKPWESTLSTLYVGDLPELNSQEEALITNLPELLGQNLLSFTQTLTTMLVQLTPDVLVRAKQYTSESVPPQAVMRTAPGPAARRVGGTVARTKGLASMRLRAAQVPQPRHHSVSPSHYPSRRCPSAGVASVRATLLPRAIRLPHMAHAAVPLAAVCRR